MLINNFMNIRLDFYKHFLMLFQQIMG